MQTVISEIDEDGNGEVSFEEFAKLAAKFLVEEEEDTEAIQLELKGAFRLYDREGKHFDHIYLQVSIESEKNLLQKHVKIKNLLKL